MRNTYTRRFVAACPINGQAINYTLSIQTDGRFIAVEDIVSATDAITSGFHEHIADELLATFGGAQVLLAHHHGVDISTYRRAA
jgi:hypothetical protein